MEQAQQARCKHDLKLQNCATCRADLMSQPLRQRKARSFSKSDPGDGRFTIVASRAALNQIEHSDKVSHVHFSRNPSAELIKILMDCFPRLQVINFAPYWKEYAEASIPIYQKILAERKILLSFERVTGRSTPTVEECISDPRWLSLRKRALRFLRNSAALWMNL